MVDYTYQEVDYQYEDANIGGRIQQSRKREDKAWHKAFKKVEKLAQVAEGSLMFKLVLIVNKKLLKVKYLSSLPTSFACLCRQAKDLLPIGMLNSLLVSDPCGDWITIENDTDIENIYNLAKIAE